MTCVECETTKLSQELQSPLNIPLIKQPRSRSRSRSRKAQSYSIEDLLTNTYGQVETLDSDNKVWCEECQKLELFNRVNLITPPRVETSFSTDPSSSGVIFVV